MKLERIAKYDNGRWKCAVKPLNWTTNGRLTKSNETLQVFFTRIKRHLQQLYDHIWIHATDPFINPSQCINDIVSRNSRTTGSPIVTEHLCLKQVRFYLRQRRGKKVYQQKSNMTTELNWNEWFECLTFCPLPSNPLALPIDPLTRLLATPVTQSNICNILRVFWAISEMSNNWRPNLQTCLLYTSPSPRDA